MPVTFQDIFKTSFLEKAAAVPLLDMAFALVLSFLLGLFVFFIYKQCYAGVMYSPSFGVTLVALCLITTLLILTVVSNIVLSLGMVGALSIVRFRTAIKEPMDIAFLFWAIAAGIVLAAGLVFLAVGGSLFIGAVLYAFSSRRSPDTIHVSEVVAVMALTLLESSIIVRTVAQFRPTSVTIPTRPPSLITFMSTAMPSSLPLLMIKVLYQLPVSREIICAATLSYSE